MCVVCVCALLHSLGLQALIERYALDDNHGDNDEHLTPYDGTIDWSEAIRLLRRLPAADLPLTLELKEKTGPEAPGFAEQLNAAARSLDRLETEFSKAS